MLKNKLFFVCSLLSITASFSQIAINAPYSRFGIGNLSQETNAINTAMGGLSSSYASQRTINTSNPALLNRLTKTTFEIGLGYTSLQTAENGKMNSSNTFAFDYLSAAFPIHRNYTLAVGLTPYSQVNYSNESTTILDANTSIRDIYNGEGGISAAHITNSFAILKDSVTNTTLNLGVNAALLAGNITKSNQSLLLLDGSENTNYTAVVNNHVYRGLKLNFGVALRP